MYKIYFNSNYIVLNDDVPENWSDNNNVVFFESVVQLQEIIQKVESQNQNYCIVYKDVPKLFKKLSTYFKGITAAGGLVVNSEGKLLVIKRLGIWDLPKGKAEDNETPQETALREVEEECGIKDLKIKKYLTKVYHTYPHKGKKVLKTTWWYSMSSSDTSTPVPQTEESITEARWLPLDELDNIKQNTYQSLFEVFDCVEV